MSTKQWTFRGSGHLFVAKSMQVLQQVFYDIEQLFGVIEQSWYTLEAILSPQSQKQYLLQSGFYPHLIFPEKVQTGLLF